MAIAPRGVRGTLTTGSTTLWTAPATGSIITNIILCNYTGAAVTATINLNAVAIISGTSIPAYTTVTYDIKQHIGNAQTVTGLAGAGTSITYHISGVDL